MLSALKKYCSDNAIDGLSDPTDTHITARNSFSEDEGVSGLSGIEKFRRLGRGRYSGAYGSLRVIDVVIVGAGPADVALRQIALRRR